MRSRSVLAGACLWLVVSAANAQEENPTIVVPPPTGGQYKAAVQRFAGDDDRAEKLRDAIGRGLDYSSLFALISPQAFLAGDVSLPLDGGPPIACPDWTQIGADALVEGAISVRGTQVAIEFRVWDVARCQKLERRRFQGTTAEVDLIGRKIADAIVKAFTGRAGVSATEIAYISDRTGKREVFVMEADGSNVRQATHNNTINGFPTWSADGQAIVYTSYREKRKPLLHVLTRGSASPGRIFKSLSDQWQIFRGVFDPTGQRLALSVSVDGQSDIFLIGRDGRGLSRITNERSLEVSPSFSPDGTRLAFVSDRSGSPHVYVMNSDGSNVRRVTFQGSYNTGAAWSPDGRWIAYETRAGGQFDIWLVDPDGSVTLPLVTGGSNDESATWSPDGRKIAFSSSRRGTRDLYTIDVDGSNLRQLTRGVRNGTSPAWGPYDRDLR